MSRHKTMAQWQLAGKPQDRLQKAEDMGLPQKGTAKKKKNRPTWQKNPMPMPWQKIKVLSKEDLFAEMRTSLYRLGFKDYQDYLRSPLWQKIKAQVHTDNRHGKCMVCQNDKATQVHHRRYDLATMQGRNRKCLVPICYQCHQYLTRDQQG